MSVCAIRMSHVQLWKILRFPFVQVKKSRYWVKVGSGKSSIEKILLSLYRPTEGAVFIDQTNIAQIDPAGIT